MDDLVSKLTNVGLSQDDFCPSDLKLVNYICTEPWNHKIIEPVRDYTYSWCSPWKNWVELFSTHKERGNIFFKALAPSGPGKAPAAQIGCSHPTVNYLEVKIGDDQQIWVDNSSISGLFNYFLNEKAVPIMSGVFQQDAISIQVFQ